jgi:hypothetical protein
MNQSALFPSSFSKIEKNLGLVINFKFFAQFHIHTLKSFLHIRMNKRSKELEVKLNNAKSVDDSILKGLEVSSFFDQQQKRLNEEKMFSEEFQKVKV